MCRRTRLWGLLLGAVGLGLLCSCLLEGILLRIFLGIGLMALGGMLLGRR